MAKKHIVTSDPLFNVSEFSSGITQEIGDIERFSYGDVSRTQSYDPYWDELLLESESNEQTVLELDKVIPANTKIGVFIVQKADKFLSLGIIINTKESGFFVDWLNFGESSENVNFLCGSNCFYNWERSEWSINKLAIAPQSLIDKFLALNPDFSLKNEDRGFDVGDGLHLNIGERLCSQQLQRTGEIVSIGKTGFSVEWDGWIKCAYSFSQIEELQLSKIEKKSCLPCSTATQEQVQPQLQVTNLELEQPNLSKLTTAPNESLDTDIQTFPSIQISEPIKDNLNVITSIGSASLVPEQVTPENVQGLTIQNQKCGSIVSERSQLNSLNLLLLNNPEELSTTDLEQFLGDSEWSSIAGKIQKSYQQRSLERPTKESEFSLLPTPTTYPKGSGKCRPAGTNRLEQKLRPFIAKGDKLHPSVPGWMMGFPIGWVEYPLADTGDLLSVQPPLIPVQATTSTTAVTALTSMDEQLHHSKQKLSLKESVILPNSPESEVLATTTNTDNQTTTTKIKALTLHQPWASLVGKYKQYETRGRSISYRGKIAIHAAIRQETTDYQVDELSDLLVGENIPFGSVIAIADLTDCIQMTEEFICQQSETELRCGLWEVGRYAWKLENVEFLPHPIPARGMPGLWNIELPITSSQESGFRIQEAGEEKIFTNAQCPMPHAQLPNFTTGEYVLNGRVGQIIEASPGEYFSVSYGKSHHDLKCYFWGQDDQLIEQLVIAPPDLIEQFLKDNLVTELCRSAEPLIEPEVSPKKKIASGSLAPYLENKKLKDGRIVSYPRVEGERDKLNHLHWRWGYYYEVKVNGEWKNRSLPTPVKIVPQVKIMIENHCSVHEIKDFILQAKNKKAGVVDS